MPEFSEIAHIVLGVVAQWTPRILGSIALLTFGWMVAGRIKRLARKALDASALDDILVPFLAGMIHVTIVVLVAIDIVQGRYRRKLLAQQQQELHGAV